MKIKMTSSVDTGSTWTSNCTRLYPDLSALISTISAASISQRAPSEMSSLSGHVSPSVPLQPSAPSADLISTLGCITDISPPTVLPDYDADQFEDGISNTHHLHLWSDWRRALNEELVGLLTGRLSDLPSTYQFGSVLPAQKVDAIYQNAMDTECHRTSLAAMQYLVYGIPRVKSYTKIREFYRSRLKSTEVMKKIAEQGSASVHRQLSSEMTNSYARDGTPKTTVLQHALIKLQREMASLMEQDLGLMKQLLTMNEVVEDLKWRQRYLATKIKRLPLSSGDLADVSDTEVCESDTISSGKLARAPNTELYSSCQPSTSASMEDLTVPFVDSLDSDNCVVESTRAHEGVSTSTGLEKEADSLNELYNDSTVTDRDSGLDDTTSHSQDGERSNKDVSSLQYHHEEQTLFHSALHSDEDKLFCSCSSGTT